MSQLIIRQRGTPTAVLETIAATGRQILARVATEWRRRRDLRQLEAMDDTALADIGLSRGGLEDAVVRGRIAPIAASRAYQAEIAPLPADVTTGWR